MSEQKHLRKTIQTTEAKIAPMRVVMYVLPFWGLCMLLSFFMPFTGVIGSLIALVALFTLPFKSKQGMCPDCGTNKLFPFSGFGSVCKGCGQELVLRGEKIHLLEEKSGKAMAGTGRSDR